MVSLMSTTPIVRAFCDRIWNAGDLEAAWVLLAPDFQFRGSLGSELRGIPPFLEYVRSVRDALAGYRCDILDCLSKGDRAFARMHFSGRHVGEATGPRDDRSRGMPPRCFSGRTPLSRACGFLAIWLRSMRP
jgi:hypothetical protein